MSDVKLDAFLPYVLPYAPNCLDVHALIGVRNALIDFCTDTRVLQVEMEPLSLRENQGIYDLEPPPGYRAAHVLELYCSDRRLEPKSPGELDRLYSRDWLKRPGHVRAYTQFNPDQVALALPPDFSAARALTGRLSVAPSRSSNYVDELVFERHVAAIADGALAWLLATPDQPYSDPKSALQRAASFRAAKATVRAGTNLGAAGGQLRVALRRKF